MKRLSIDQSYNFCAYVIWDQDTVESFGLISSKKITGDVYDKARFVATEIEKICNAHNITQIDIEGLAFGATGNVARDLAGLLFSIINITKNSIPTAQFTIHPPTSVKKLATGTSKGVDKKQMIAALPEDVRSLFELAGYKKTTGLSDLADAYWIGCCSRL